MGGRVIVAKEWLEFRLIMDDGEDVVALSGDKEVYLLSREGVTTCDAIVAFGMIKDVSRMVEFVVVVVFVVELNECGIDDISVHVSSKRRVAMRTSY
jgi:hypothetical protein